jgi:hypothetical protein
LILRPGGADAGHQDDPPANHSLARVLVSLQTKAPECSSGARSLGIARPKPPKRPRPPFQEHHHPRRRAKYQMPKPTRTTITTPESPVRIESPPPSLSPRRAAFATRSNMCSPHPIRYSILPSQGWLPTDESTKTTSHNVPRLEGSAASRPRRSRSPPLTHSALDATVRPPRWGRSCDDDDGPRCSCCSCATCHSARRKRILRIWLFVAKRVGA